MAGPGHTLVVTKRDDAYTISRHTIGGKQASRDLRRGRAVHVFHEPLDLDFIEQKVWNEGTYLGKVGLGIRASFDRFVWSSPAPVGRRVEPGKADLALFWVEIKGKIVARVWVYHLVPRAKPPS